MRFWIVAGTMALGLLFCFALTWPSRLSPAMQTAGEYHDWLRSPGLKLISSRQAGEVTVEVWQKPGIPDRMIYEFRSGTIYRSPATVLDAAPATAAAAGGD